MYAWEWNTIINFCDCIEHNYSPERAEKKAMQEMDAWIKRNEIEVAPNEKAEMKRLIEILRKTIFKSKNREA